jgi:hypothetical protein
MLRRAADGASAASGACREPRGYKEAAAEHRPVHLSMGPAAAWTRSAPLGTHRDLAALSSLQRSATSSEQFSPLSLAEARPRVSSPVQRVQDASYDERTLELAHCWYSSSHCLRPDGVHCSDTATFALRDSTATTPAHLGILTTKLRSCWRESTSRWVDSTVSEDARRHRADTQVARPAVRCFSRRRACCCDTRG